MAFLGLRRDLLRLTKAPGVRVQLIRRREDDYEDFPFDFSLCIWHESYPGGRVLLSWRESRPALRDLVHVRNTLDHATAVVGREIQRMLWALTEPDPVAAYKTFGE